MVHLYIRDNDGFSVARTVTELEHSSSNPLTSVYQSFLRYLKKYHGIFINENVSAFMYTNTGNFTDAA